MAYAHTTPRAAEAPSANRPRSATESLITALAKRPARPNNLAQAWARRANWSAYASAGTCPKAVSALEGPGCRRRARSSAHRTACSSWATWRCSRATCRPGRMPGKKPPRRATSTIGILEEAFAWATGPFDGQSEPGLSALGQAIPGRKTTAAAIAECRWCLAG